MNKSLYNHKYICECMFVEVYAPLLGVLPQLKFIPKNE